jgi:GntR family transcriptional regulator
MVKLALNSIEPLYRQVYNIILKAIKAGEFHPGDKLPSEDMLQEHFKVSRVTVRTALQLLVDDEVLVKIHGKGTFVAEGRFSENIFSGGSFTDTCLRMNAKPATHIISRKVITAKARIAEKLGTKAGEDIIYIKRLRLVNGTACILEQDYCPMNLRFLLESELENASIFSLIRNKSGMIPEVFEDRFTVWYATKEEAVLLECKPGTALLRVDQLIRAGGSFLYYNEQLIHSDRYTYATRYR